MRAFSMLICDLDGTLYPHSSPYTAAFDARITAYIEQHLGLGLAETLALRHQYYTTYGTTLRGLQLHNHVDTEGYLAYVHSPDASAYLAPDLALDQLLGELPVRRAVMTNSPREHADKVLAALGIAHRFERVFDIRFVAFEPKPSLSAYFRVLDALGVNPRDTVLVEDTIQNLPPAREIGMRTVLIREVAGPPVPAADLEVPDIHAALRLLVDGL